MPLNVDTFTCVGGLLHPWHFGLLLSGRIGTLWKCWKTLIGSRMEKQVSHRFTGVFHIPTVHSSSLCGAGALPVAAGLLPAPEPAEECQAIYLSAVGVLCLKIIL